MKADIYHRDKKVEPGTILIARGPQGVPIPFDVLKVNTTWGFVWMSPKVPDGISLDQELPVLFSTSSDLKYNIAQALTSQEWEELSSKFNKNDEDGEEWKNA